MTLSAGLRVGMRMIFLDGRIVYEGILLLMGTSSSNLRCYFFISVFVTCCAFVRKYQILTFVELKLQDHV